MSKPHFKPRNPGVGTRVECYEVNSNSSNNTKAYVKDVSRALNAGGDAPLNHRARSGERSRWAAFSNGEATQNSTGSGADRTAVRARMSNHIWQPNTANQHHDNASTSTGNQRGTTPNSSVTGQHTYQQQHVSVGQDSSRDYADNNGISGAGASRGGRGESRDRRSPSRATSGAPPTKRGRGRPLGSRNKTPVRERGSSRVYRSNHRSPHQREKSRSRHREYSTSSFSSAEEAGQRGHRGQSRSAREASHYSTSSRVRGNSRAVSRRRTPSGGKPTKQRDNRSMSRPSDAQQSATQPRASWGSYSIPKKSSTNSTPGVVGGSQTFFTQQQPSAPHASHQNPFRIGKVEAYRPGASTTTASQQQQGASSSGFGQQQPTTATIHTSAALFQRADKNSNPQGDAGGDFDYLPPSPPRTPSGGQVLNNSAPATSSIYSTFTLSGQLADPRSAARSAFQACSTSYSFQQCRTTNRQEATGLNGPRLHLSMPAGGQARSTPSIIKHEARDPEMAEVATSGADDNCSLQSSVISYYPEQRVAANNAAQQRADAMNNNAVQPAVATGSFTAGAKSPNVGQPGGAANNTAGQRAAAVKNSAFSDTRVISHNAAQRAGATSNNTAQRAGAISSITAGAKFQAGQRGGVDGSNIGGRYLMPRMPVRDIEHDLHAYDSLTRTQEQLCRDNKKKGHILTKMQNALQECMNDLSDAIG